MDSHDPEKLFTWIAEPPREGRLSVAESSAAFERRRDGLYLVRSDDYAGAAWEIHDPAADTLAYLLGIAHAGTDYWFAEPIEPETGSRSAVDADGPRYVFADGRKVFAAKGPRP